MAANADSSSSNPVKRDIIDNVYGPKYIEVKGHKFSPKFNLDSINYQARPDDIFIATYPKCGTTWTQIIVVSILNGGKIPPSKDLFDISPFLEYSNGKNMAENLPRPCLIKSHMPYELFPKHLSAKYILVLRNPKDALVSYNYHIKSRVANYDVAEIDFHDFFKFYLAGNIPNGSYFEWVKGWIDHVIDKKDIDQDKKEIDQDKKEIDPDNVLILIYEDMKTDIRAAILKIARFLGDQYLQDLTADNEAKLKNVISCSFFDNIKDKTQELGFFDGFFRKGVIGDYKNHMTDQESDMIDKLFHQYFDGTYVEHLWEKYDIMK